jgi:hypothetical protein
LLSGPTGGSRAPARIAAVRARIALAGLAAALLLPAAASPSTVAKRSVTVQLSGSGIATWEQTGADDVYTLAMRYSWKGTLKFKIPTTAFGDPAHAKFKASTRGTLTASWNGVAEGRRGATGPFRCEYKGTDAPGPVLATLANAKRPGTLELTMHPRAGAVQFFSPTGQNATVNCNTTTFGTTGPPHFSPGSLFRDTFTVRGFMTTNTAIIPLSSKLLSKRTVTVTFPAEVGKKVSPLLGNFTWHNRGKVVARAR